MNADRNFGVFFALLGVAILYFTQGVSNAFPDTGDPGPRLLPNILGVLMAALGLVLALRAAPATALSPETAQVVQTAAADTPTTLLPPPSLWRRMGIALAFVLLIALFEPLGFSLAAFLFLAGSMVLMDEFSVRRAITRSGVALVVVIGLGLLVTRILKLPVSGVWFG